MNASIRRLQGVDFVYFVTRNPHLVESYSKRYLQLPFPISNMVRIRDIDDQLDAIEMRRPSLMKIAYLSARVINRASNLLGGGGPKEPDFRVVETHQFDDRVDDLWHQVSNRHDFIVERRRDYLNWRYLDPRAGQYVIKQAESDEGRLLGFCVLRINRYLKDYPIGYVTDILTAPERPDVADSLIGEAARHFDENRVNTVLCSMVKNNLYYDILKRHGFLDSRTPFNLFFAVTKDVENVKRLRGTTAGRVYFSLGDIDSLPIGMERG